MHTNLNFLLRKHNNRDTWSHLLPTCANQHIKGLRIAQHNKAVHLIARTLQAYKSTRFFYVNQCRHNQHQNLDLIITCWLLSCTCHTIRNHMRQPFSWLLHYFLHVSLFFLGTHNHSHGTYLLLGLKHNVL